MLCSYILLLCYYQLLCLFKSTQPLPLTRLGKTKPPPPENCTMARQTQNTIQVKCSPPQNTEDNPPILYMMQVYDAETRIFLGTATSETPQMTFESVPKNHDGLELFIRTTNAYSFTSDATVLFVPPKPEFRIKTGGKNEKNY